MRPLVLLLCVCACGGRLADDNASQNDATSDASPVNPFVGGQHWKGTYYCAQGLTNLDLQIVSTHGDTIDDALFNFDWSGGISGSFHLSGTFDPTTLSATFAPGAWINHPAHWYSVGMAGTVDVSTMSYTGNIADPVHAACGTFSVELAH